jgi:hypothetical protein
VLNEADHSADGSGMTNRRTWWMGCAALVPVAITFALWMDMGWGGSRVTLWVSGIGQLVAALAAGVLCLVAVRRDPDQRRFWTWMAASALVWMLGQAVWCWYQLIRAVPTPFPSVADIGFLGATVIALVAISQYRSTARRSVPRIRTILDWVVLAGSLVFMSWATVLSTTTSVGGKWLNQTVSAAYPIGDIAVALVVLAMLAGRKRRELDVGFLCVAGGLLILAASDSAFTYLLGTGGFSNLNVAYTGWVLGYLVIALGALRPQPTDDLPRNAVALRVQTVLPVVALVGAVTTLFAKVAAGGRIDTFLILTGAVVLAAVVARALVGAHSQPLTSDLAGHRGHSTAAA